MKLESNKNNNQSTCAIGIINNQSTIPSTPVENVRQIRLFLQNKPNFPRFSTNNEDFTKKQTQFKPKQTQFWANIKGSKAKQTQFHTPLFDNVISLQSARAARCVAM